MIQRAEQAQGKIIETDTYIRVFLNSDPGMTHVKVISLGYAKSPDIQDI